MSDSSLPKKTASPDTGSETATTCGFSFDHYSYIMSQFLQGGYQFLHFTDAPKAEKYIYLRHDVDRSLEKALALALLEQQLGIKSTYFVRLHSRYYNCYSFPGLKALRDIRSAGHEIGLHTEFYDLAKIFGDDGMEVFARENASSRISSNNRCASFRRIVLLDQLIPTRYIVTSKRCAQPTTCSAPSTTSSSVISNTSPIPAASGARVAPAATLALILAFKF
ncbi:MAG: hypothetical protein IPH59_09250 [bacterium]|nr:hypothetical protein [bacterium]